MKEFLKSLDWADLFFAAGLGLFTAGIWRGVGMDAALFCSGCVLLFTALRK